jgi:L-cysteine desulfidase
VQQNLAARIQSLKDDLKLSPTITITIAPPSSCLSPVCHLLNAAFNYCSVNDIQMYIEGSFELIGR